MKKPKKIITTSEFSTGDKIGCLDEIGPKNVYMLGSSTLFYADGPTIKPLERSINSIVSQRFYEPFGAPIAELSDKEFKKLLEGLHSVFENFIFEHFEKMKLESRSMSKRKQ